ncbi:MAG: type VI secretion system ATPase TssH [Bacteroidota bacterium]
MITKDLKKLLGKLNDPLTQALEGAAGFCISRGHYEVTIEHLLIKLLEAGGTDLERICDHFGIDVGRLRDHLLVHIEGFRTGNTGRPTFSPIMLSVMESAWIVASVHHGLGEVRSGAILEALLEQASMQNAPYMDVLEPVNRDQLRADFASIVAGSMEERRTKRSSLSAGGDGAAGAGLSTELELYTVDLTAKARDGGIDPISGRDKEIRQVIDILSRRRKNNPILVGEAGVGKTAVVEGLALRIAAGDVPDSLKEVSIRTMDLGLLQAGASVKGEFENRLKGVIDGVKESAKPIILFIDEAHTLIGAGGSAGTGDAANLLKPPLARGELRTVAATTWSEYKKYIEKDPALERRFQQVKVEEPSAETAGIMLRGIKSKYEDHHDVQITDEAVQAAAELSDRYITGRNLPDKAVDLLDTACARVRMTQNTRPGQLEDLDRRIHHLNVEIKAVRRDLDAALREEAAELEELEAELASVQEQREDVEARWNQEKELVQQIVEARRAFVATNALAAGDGAPPAEDDPARAKLFGLHRELETLQGGEPMVFAEVNEQVAAQVVADWTGIPVGDMVKDDASRLLEMEGTLGVRILGQDEGIGQVAESVRTAKAGLGNPDAPLAVFLFVGPSGVGKTEMAYGIADLLFGGERFLTTINMSEYQEKHTVSQLKGSPPGYVGYGEGGILTEAVRQRPYSVVLLDEVEKAHRDVMNLFYQVFDKGFMRDGEGREVNFRNTVIIMTSNLASDIITYVSPEGERPTPDQIREAIHPTLVEYFQPALLGRMKVVPFYPLHKETMKGIVKLKLQKIARRLEASHGIAFTYGEDVMDTIAERCTQIDTGARNVDFIIDRNVLPEASRALIANMVEGNEPTQLELGLDEEGDFTYTFS